MKFILVIILVATAFARFTAEDATKLSNEALDLQKNTSANEYVDNIILPLVEKNAKRGECTLVYPDSYYAKHPENGASYEQVAAVLRHLGFSVDITTHTAHTAYELASNPPPKYITMKTGWDCQYSISVSNPVIAQRYDIFSNPTAV